MSTLKRYLKRRKAELLRANRYATHEQRIAVHKRARGRCEYCGTKLTLQEGVVDHIVPYSRGGYSTLTNFARACWSCNKLKGARTPQEWKPITLKNFRKGEP